jgi:hypothetical protein
MEVASDSHVLEHGKVLAGGAGRASAPAAKFSRPMRARATAIRIVSLNGLFTSLKAVCWPLQSAPALGNGL